MDEKLKQEIINFVSIKDMIDVFDEESKAQILDIVGQGYAKKKRVESILEPIVKANHTAWKLSTQTKSDLIKPIDEIIALGKSALAKYSFEQEKKLMEQQKLTEKKMEKAGIDPALIPAVAKPKASIDGYSNSIDYSFEVVDVAKIPREYMTPDTKKIGAVIRAMKDTASIAGIKVIKKHGLKRIGERGKKK